jgi:hypothetical protein
MEVGQGPNWGCSGKENEMIFLVPSIFHKKSISLEIYLGLFLVYLTTLSDTKIMWLRDGPVRCVEGTCVHICIYVYINFMFLYCM